MGSWQPRPWVTQTDEIILCPECIIHYCWPHHKLQDACGPRFPSSLPWLLQWFGWLDLSCLIIWVYVSFPCFSFFVSISVSLFFSILCFSLPPSLSLSLSPSLVFFSDSLPLRFFLFPSSHSLSLTLFHFLSLLFPPLLPLSISLPFSCPEAIKISSLVQVDRCAVNMAMFAACLQLSCWRCCSHSQCIGCSV